MTTKISKKYAQNCSYADHRLEAAEFAWCLIRRGTFNYLYFIAAEI